MSWQATILTLFPEMFPGPLGLSLAGKALGGGVWSCQTHDLRQHGLGRHRAVDDTPFGGGAGMVIRADVVDAALSAIQAPEGAPRVFLTPRGRPLCQQDVSRYAQGPGVVLLCGRFEGVDERVLEARGIEQVSIGDYVLSGVRRLLWCCWTHVSGCCPVLWEVMKAAWRKVFPTGCWNIPITPALHHGTGETCRKSCSLVIMRQSRHGGRNRLKK